MAASIAGGDIQCIASTISGSCNLIGDASSAGGLTNGTNGNIVGNLGSGIIPIAMVLDWNTTTDQAVLADNGGPTETVALVTGSPAIDAGANSLAVDTTGNPLTTDQRGSGYERIVNGTADIGAYEYGAGPPDTFPEITVEGNNTVIPDGDTTPSMTDNTDFGDVDTDSGTVSRNFVIRNIGTANLNLTGTPVVALSGDNASDFSVTIQPASLVVAGGTTTFQVRFDPSDAGLRFATISIENNDSDENPYYFAIQGAGTLPNTTYTLTVGKTGTGGGTVISSPAGINCGTDCTEVYASGTMVTLTATPAAWSTFTGWSDEECTGTENCTVTMDAAKIITATFSLDPYASSRKAIPAILQLLLGQ